MVGRGVILGGWVFGGGGPRCRVRGLVMGFRLVAVGGGTCGGGCWRGLAVAGAGGDLRVLRLLPGLGGGWGGMVWGRHYWWWGGRGWVLCWTGVWASRRVVWVLPVRALRFLRSLAGCGVGVRVGGGCLGIRVGLWSVGSGGLLVEGACWYGVRLGGLVVVFGCSLYALLLFVGVPGPPRVNEGVRMPECREPVQWGR